MLYNYFFKKSPIILVFFFYFYLSSPVEASFNSEVSNIEDIINLNITNFSIDITDSINSEIAYLKIRGMCDKRISLQVDKINICHKSFKLVSKGDFIVSYKNKDEIVKKFKIQIKAYDQNGKWLQTEKESFRWK